MDRKMWQALAHERVLAAQALLVAKHWPSAYYLAGYAVEFGLKSCILVRLAATPTLIFKEKNFSSQCWSHSVKDLVTLAGLDDVVAADNATNPVLAQNWSIVRAWRENSRYENKSQIDAEELFNAITDATNGVLPWIKLRW
ncbi:MAG: DNA-binding protein [Planctomycetes bacterium]|nr:DNA-binding protein [Planctomycetota bacterium]